jgi:hypothetical protein
MSVGGPLGRLVHGEHVHPVGDLFRHVVGASPAIHVPHCRGALERGAHPVAVVLHYEHHGELPQRRHVERFVERADVDRRLAEEADGDLVGAAVLGGEGGACRQRQVCAHDAVPAEPPLPAEQPVRLPNSSAITARGLVPRSRMCACSR